MFRVKTPAARARLVALALGFALLAPGGLRAQNLSFGSINGTVTDASGGALPGVTITASSPALQVGQLTAVTDGEGNIKSSTSRAVPTRSASSCRDSSR